MNRTLGDVLIVRFRQFTEPRTKIRPVVVILDIDDIVVVPVTSVRRAGPGDIPLSEWKQAGLSLASTVRLAKTTLILKRATLDRVGRLTSLDRRRLVEAWRILYDLKP